jgi:hypothetical protein
MDPGEDAACVEEQQDSRNERWRAISTLLRPTSEFHRQVSFRMNSCQSTSNVDFWRALCPPIAWKMTDNGAGLQVRRDVHKSLRQQNVSTAALGDDLRSFGYTAVLHTNYEGDTNVSCLQSLRHTFIVCTGSSGVLAHSIQSIS